MEEGIRYPEQQFLRELRKKAGLTQRQLAAEIGVSAQQCGLYERGMRRLPLSLFFRYLKVFGICLASAEEIEQLHFARMTYPHAAESVKSLAAENVKFPDAKSTKFPAVESTKFPAAESTKFPAAESAKFPAAESAKFPAAESTKFPAAETPACTSLFRIFSRNREWNPGGSASLTMEEQRLLRLYRSLDDTGQIYIRLALLSEHAVSEHYRHQKLSPAEIRVRRQEVRRSWLRPSREPSRGFRETLATGRAAARADHDS